MAKLNCNVNQCGGNQDGGPFLLQTPKWQEYGLSKFSIII